MIDLIAYMPRFLNVGETLHGSEFAAGYGARAQIKQLWQQNY
jgi:hypothetical protein